MMGGQLKGVLLTIASAASVSVTFIASKQAMQQLTPLGFTAPWFAVASLWGVAFYLFRNGPVWPASLKRDVSPPQNSSEVNNTFQRSAVSRPRSALPTVFWPILLLGFLNGLANYLFFTSINLGDPTLVAFFSRSEVIYTVLLGTWLLGERLRAYQWAGVAIAVAGAGLMTFRAGAVVWLMLLLTLASNFFLAFSGMVQKTEKLD